MARRSDHSKAELEDMIFDAALELIEKEGLTGLSARKIAAKISYSPGTIYSFYESLDELILKINASTLDQIYKALTSCVSKCSSPDRIIRDLTKCYLDYAFENNNRWNALYKDSCQQNSRINLPEWYQEKIDRIFSLLETKINEISGTSKHNKIQAQIFWASLHGIATLTLSGHADATKTKPVAMMIDEFCDIFLAGIKA